MSDQASKNKTSKLQVEIITPDRVAFSDQVDFVIIPSAAGQLTILPHHTPLFAQLVEGELKIKKGNQERFLSIGGGFIEVTKEKTTILVTKAVHADELNEAEILKAKKEAGEALKEKPKGEALRLAQALMRSSLIDLQVLRRRKRPISEAYPR